MKTKFTLFAALSGLTFLASGCIAQTPATPATNATQPFRLFMMGNSLTDQVNFGALQEMSKSGPQPIYIERQTIPGAPIGWIKDHPGTENTWIQALEKGNWDGLSLQPYQWGYTENIRDIPPVNEKFLAGSPEGQLFIYAQWPDNKGGDWTRRWLLPREKSIMSRQEYEDTVSWLHQNLKAKKPARLVPAGHVMHLLEQKAKAGQVPGLKTMWDVYDDEVHLSNIGSLIAGTTFYATVLGRSPEGLDFSAYAKGRQPISPELARVIQQTVWEVVATHPMTGVQSDLPPKIATPILDQAVQGSAYSQEIFAAFGQAPRRFRVKSGALPVGITLNEQGILEGTPTATGTAKFEIEVSDKTGKRGSRALTLQTVGDSSPEITTTALPAMKQGQYLRVALAGKSDNAPFFWNVEKAKLPPGLTFTDAGVLEGTPATTGAFELPISVTDGDTEDPETTTKIFAFNVAPAGDEVIFARHVDWKADINGKFDEGEKWDFKHKIAVAMEGKPDGEISMDVVYNDDSLCVAVLVKDQTVISETGRIGALEDQVNIYLDAKNNREAVYNWDDFRFTNTPSGSKSGVRDGWWAWANSTQVEGGYLVEGHWNWGSIRPGLRREEQGGQSFGLEVQVVDVDEKGGPIVSRTGWVGAKDADTNPSGFRTIITLPAPPKP